MDRYTIAAGHYFLSGKQGDLYKPFADASRRLRQWIWSVPSQAVTTPACVLPLIHETDLSEG